MLQLKISFNFILDQGEHFEEDLRDGTGHLESRKLTHTHNTRTHTHDTHTHNTHTHTHTQHTTHMIYNIFMILRIFVLQLNIVFIHAEMWLCYAFVGFCVQIQIKYMWWVSALFHWDSPDSVELCLYSSTQEQTAGACKRRLQLAVLGLILSILSPKTECGCLIHGGVIENGCI